MARLLYCEFANKIYEVPDDYERDPTVKSRRETACCPACGGDIHKPTTLKYYHSLWGSQLMTPKEIRDEAKEFLFYYHMTDPKKATKRRK